MLFVAPQANDIIIEHFFFHAGECSFANIYDYEANKDRFRDMYLSSKKDPRIEVKEDNEDNVQYSIFSSFLIIHTYVR